MPASSIPDWLPAVATGAIAGLFGWLTGRRGANANAAKAESEAAKTDAETAKILIEAAAKVAEEARKDTADARKSAEEARKLAADASAKAEMLRIENDILSAKVDHVLDQLVAYVLDWDAGCRHCDTRPVMPSALLEYIKKMNNGGGGNH